MKIALLGYGKMGKEIEQVALERGHEISAKFDDQHPVAAAGKIEADAAIDFSVPDAAVASIRKCVDQNLPLVMGTTGWYDQFEEMKRYIQEKDGSFLYATNFSIGVNLFFKLNKVLAEIMDNHTDYEVNMKEVHHTEKLDAPSGTAITLAEDLLTKINRKKSWINQPSSNKEELSIVSERIPEVRGTHRVHYHNDIDEITIEHKAKSRKGFALGAVLAAEWLINKKGIFTMKDVLEIN